MCFFLPGGDGPYHGPYPRGKQGTPGGIAVYVYCPVPIWWKNILTKVCKRIRAKLAKSKK